MAIKVSWRARSHQKFLALSREDRRAKSAASVKRSAGVMPILIRCGNINGRARLAVWAGDGTPEATISPTCGRCASQGAYDDRKHAYR